MLNAKKLGLAGGILGGLATFVFTLIAHFTGYGESSLNRMSDVYPGYTVSFGGAFGGLVYAFIANFIALFLLAWIYNWLEHKKRR